MDVEHKILDQDWKQNPNILFHQLLYLMGTRFALRGQSDHANLLTSYITEDVLNDGSIRLCCELKFDKTHRPTMKNPTPPPPKYSHCASLLEVYRFYISKRPQGDKVSNRLYLRPKRQLSLLKYVPIGVLQWSSSEVWFDNSPVGKHKIADVYKNVIKNVGAEKRTNHAGRSSAVTRCFEARIPDHEVRQLSGHKSEALFKYNLPSAETYKRVSDAASGVPAQPEYKPKITLASGSKLSSKDGVEIEHYLQYSTLTNCSVNIYKA
jgi:hypothetical protein